jgi:hypothetical protein
MAGKPISDEQIKKLLKGLESPYAIRRRDDAKSLSRVSQSNRAIVMGLLQVANSDSDSSVRDAARLSLTAPVHQSIIKEMDTENTGNAEPLASQQVLTQPSSTSSNCCPQCGYTQEEKQGTATWKLLTIGGFGIFLLLMGITTLSRSESSLMYSTLGVGLLLVAWWASRPQQVVKCKSCGYSWNSRQNPTAAQMQTGPTQQHDTPLSAKASPSSKTERTTSERLAELQTLLDNRAITEDEYTQKREAILRDL